MDHHVHVGKHRIHLLRVPRAKLVQMVTITIEITCLTQEFNLEQSI